MDAARISVKLPRITEPQTPFVLNMKALWEKWPMLAQEIDLVDERDLIDCQQTRSDNLTCRLPGTTGEPVWLHSRYDPKREAQRWAQGAIEQAEKQQEEQDEESNRIPMCYFVDGFGLGYHIESLFNKLTGEAFIVVSERNLPLVRTALTRLDYSEMLESGRVIIITGTEREEIFKKLQPRAAMMMLGVAFTRSLQRVDTEFHSEVHKFVAEYASFMRSHLISLLANCLITCKNIIYNLPTYVGTSSIGILNNRFKGCPAVIVSAGPSLKRNLAKLKEIRDKVVVIAVQTTLKPLLAEGIVPDFVTSLDYHEVSKRFFEGVEDLSDVHLVAEPKATWYVIDYCRPIGPVSLLHNEFAQIVLRGMKDEHEGLTAGATVAHLSFYLAEYIGADPIIFIGQDLSFTDNVYYSPGNALHEVWKGELNRFCTIEMKEWERIVRNRNMLREVEDIHGQSIYTDEQMFTYLQQFEKDFARCPARVIDATEGGVRKQNCRAMSLKETAARYCVELIDQGKFDYRGKINKFKTGDFRQCREILQKRVEEAQEMKEICLETIELVREMLTLVDKQKELNRKMVRLDELRTKVKRRKEIYQLVMFVSQAAEMYRFRQDRTIELDDPEGKERQRRQLKRDIGYVTEIKNGCDRLLTLLEDGIERFDKEIDNE
jgi:hypothetical protein